MRRIALLFAAIASAAFAGAVVIPSTCESALRRSMNGDAAWRMERTLAGSTKPLVSTGFVHTVAGEGIVWEVRWPFPSKVTMSTNSMTFVDDEGTRTRPLSEMPHYEDIRREANRFLAGNPEAFDGAFRVDTLFTDDGRWKLIFVPEARAVKRIASSFELVGDRMLERALLRSPDGSVTTIVFTDLGIRNGEGTDRKRKSAE